MKSHKLSMLLWGLIPLTLGTLSGCGGDGKDPSPRNNLLPPGTVQINATAGGINAKPDDPANKYTYFNLDTGEVVALTDADAETSTDWHIAFKRTKVKLNGGASGPGGVRGAVADSQDDFYQADGSPNDSVFLDATAESESAAFDSVTSSAGLTFEEEDETPAIKGDGSSGGWWLYNPQTHAITANSDGWWLIRSAKGDSYARMRVTNIVQTSKEVTLEMFVQGKDENLFSETPITWTAAIGAAGGSKCYDFDDAGQVDCSGLGQGSWDIMVDISGRDWNIWTNGTVKGFGKGKAFGKIEDADIGNYVSATTSSSGEDISALYKAAGSGLFGNNTWYAYGLLDDNKLWPNYRVYAIDTGTARHKLQISNYYNAGGASGHITLRHAPILNSEKVNVTLEEWGISLDKTTVKAGNVKFSVTNKGPDDVHEFVVVKTDLAPDALPVDLQSVVDENGAGMTIIGEIEDISVGTDVHVTSMDLEPGNYVLICNIWDEDEQESHYGEGMRVAFTVTTD